MIFSAPKTALFWPFWRHYCTLVLLLLMLSAIFVPQLPAANIELAVYIDSLDASYYYHSFQYLAAALDLDGMSSVVQPLSRLRFKPAKYNEQKIYVVLIYERNLEKYQEVLHVIDSSENLVLWLMTAADKIADSMSSFANLSLDAISSASSKAAFQQDFRSQILPRILTLYTKLFNG